MPRDNQKRFERRQAIAAARELDAAIMAYYYTEYPDSEEHWRYKALYRAQAAFNATALPYFLGVNRTGVTAWLKRRKIIRTAQRRLVA